MMTCQEKNTAIASAMELLINNGFDGMAQVFEKLMNTAMQLERERYLKAGSYERTETRQGYANGYKPKAVNTRLGELDLRIPQVRDSSFYPQSLERGLRSERALKLALAQMYVQGVSTRKIARITEELCGFEITSSQISRVAAELDADLEAWRTRPLGSCPYLMLDARYEKVRHGGRVVSCAVLIAVGVDAQGKRSVLGVSVRLSEQEVHWREFLRSLLTRGLHGVEFIVSDAHEGLKAALQAVFPNTAWQRCQFHLQQNAQKYIPRRELKREAAADIRAIFNASSESEAKRLLDIIVSKYQAQAPALSKWMENNLAEGFAVFSLPEYARRRLRTTNMLERLNKEIKRRTRVATLFPNEGSCLRLVTAVLAEVSEEWETGRCYLGADKD